ncbi:hypothetical protein CRE_29355 [Caenorhabditis remanei]|uniref:Uncharacterized protein n=1 Tax=Caenorhabditis remanei TaxID=31234 RepID=E3MY18_CAERE|nr:hypothetical protein CRE_29355 [Caenorhabditis remanei]
MSTKLFISLFISAILNAETTKLPSTPLLNIEEELASISNSCLSRLDHVEITGYKLPFYTFMTFNMQAASTVLAQFRIGAMELRAALGMPPHGPWKQETILKEEEILAASTIKEYYERREQSLISSLRLDNTQFFEKYFPSAVAFLDKRFPAIRKIYRQEFRNAKKVVDRETVDSMISKYRDVYQRFNEAVTEMQKSTLDCWRENLEIYSLLG